MSVLVDSSVWVAYFCGSHDVPTLDGLIQEGLVVTNDIILAELTPALLLRGERNVVNALHEMECIPLVVEWSGIIGMQVACLRHGINKVGLPDLMVAQTAIQHNLSLFTLDKHFRLLGKHVPLVLH